MRLLVRILFAGLLFPGLIHAQAPRLLDAYPDKARYAPSDPVHIVVDLDGKISGGEQVSAAIWQLGTVVGHCESVRLEAESDKTQALACAPPHDDYRGYLVTVRLSAANGSTLSERQTAIDISSDWKRFPRYGYLAHYNAAEVADPGKWIDELNRFHINGLEFYDFQYRHDQPLAGTVDHPQATWKDIANRTIDGALVREFIDQAHRYNMMAMAYNASYSAYDDVFSRPQNPLPLSWATWTTDHGPRTVASVKKLPLDASDWSTHFLYYMNQNDPGWQGYLFDRMRDLFAVYPFDGWHVDTFGDKGGYAFDGTRVDFVSGFQPFVDRAQAALQKRIVFHSVNALGQECVAHSSADFVYSEFWDDHETFANILETAEQVHLANPQEGMVIAAYVNRHEAKDGPPPAATQFNVNDVLLTDAAIFASGASHIELGDGARMLSSEYFPADTRLAVSPALRETLRHYYDYLTAYENYLRDEMQPANVDIRIAGQPTDPLAVPNTIWTIARRKQETTIIHLINLEGSSDAHWRDIEMKRPDAPVLENLHVAVSSPEEIRSVGWASPDMDSGQLHSVPFQKRRDSGTQWIEFTLPQLHYWDTVFLLP